MHTTKDLEHFATHGINPNNTQPRDHPVKCFCNTPTWNQNAKCDRHYNTTTKALNRARKARGETTHRTSDLPFPHDQHCR